MAGNKEIVEIIKNCNHDMVQSLLVKKFSGSVIPKELASLLDQYFSNPCTETAMEIIKFDGNFLSFFELAREGGFARHLFDSGDLK